MRIILFWLCLLLSFPNAFAQESQTIDPRYRAEREKVNALVHTKLKVGFDYAKRQLLGEAWITVEPYFYPVNHLELDAKAMLIHKVTLENKELAFDYDGSSLSIQLPKTYNRGSQYTVYISYTARPEEVEQQGSSAITSAKGLYFIDPDGADPDKPTQIWTQGETESSSCWFPTIDSPNQKTSQEIFMTVPSKYVTLSNGLLMEQKDNGDGTRTDYWKLEQKHAPYLFFMGVGEFSVVKDKWKDLEVDYYVEKEYEPYAKGIFGLTPEMMDFYSDYTGVTYVWPKYAQMVGRDYVSGAMENTTAVLHGERAYQTDAQLLDENYFESTIAHELFHHWFGDLVTTESWSNLTLNESFANYSEYLWFEHKYGRDFADAHRHEEIEGYMGGGNETKDLVRFHYNQREDMFDAVSYNKGGTILHMLRGYLGDDAFRAGMKLYLEENKYGTGEVHQLRLAFEKVSGKDLNWFFNQWYYGSGHPKLQVDYAYDDAAKSVTVNIRQTQENLFRFPLAIEVYEGEKVSRNEVWMDQKEHSFTFRYNKKPNLVNVDSDRNLLCEMSDAKTMENLVHQYKYAPRYADRREAIEGLTAFQDNEDAYATLVQALSDPFYGLRILAVDKIDLSKEGGKKALKSIEEMAVKDEKTLVRAKAISKLEQQEGGNYASLYKQALESPSNAIKVSALQALYKEDREAALAYAASIDDKLEKETMKAALIPVYILDKTESEMPFVADNLIEGMFFSTDNDKKNTYKEGFQWVAGSSSEQATQNLVDSFVQLGNQYKQYGADKVAVQVLSQVMEAKKASDYENKEELVRIVQDGLDQLQ